MTGEQLNASLSTASRQVSDWFSGLPASKIHNLVCGLLVLWLVYGLAQLVMTLIPASIPEPAADTRAPLAESTGPAQSAVDIAALQAFQLFGEAGAAPQATEAKPVPVVNEEEINAEKTRLKLSLEGIVYSPSQQDSAAVIVHSGKQELFLVGDKIPVANNVSLARVLLDRVILDNNGKLESLWLYDEEKSASRVNTPGRRTERPVQREEVADMRKNESITDMAEDYRERLFQNPASLAEVIRISPAQQNGEMVGYRISPGKDREQFESLGLRANDIVTGINGIELNEPSNALEVYKLMRTATEASFTIDRNGEPLEIMVSLGQ